MRIRATFLKVLRPARMEPPIHVEYLRSGGAYILILTSLSASFFTSFSRRSPKPVENANVRNGRYTGNEKRRAPAECAAAAQDDVREQALPQV